MTSPLAGSARIEIIGDLSKFAGNTEQQIKQALGRVTAQVKTEVGKTEPVMGEAGKRAGESYSTHAGEGIRSSGGSVRTAASRVGEEGGSALAEHGRVAGEKFGEGAKEGLHHMSAAIFGGIGAIGIGEFVAKGLEAADQLEGANIKIEGAFGESSAGVRAWAQTMATQLGQSAQEAENAAGTFGQMFHAMGIGQEEAATMSEKLDSLVQNVAKFNNADPATVQQAFIAAMRGRGKALMQLGINLDSTTLASEALSHHIVQSTVDHAALTAAQDKYGASLASQTKIDKDANSTALQRKTALDAVTVAHAKLTDVMKGHMPTLTQSEKGEAAYYAILDGTKNQQNAVADSSHTLAQQKKILGAEVTNLEAKFGNLLQPALARIAENITNNLIPALSDAGHWIKQNSDWLVPLVTILGTAAVTWKVVGAATSAYKFIANEVGAAMRLLGLATAAETTEQEGLNVAMDANPIGLIITAIAALAAGIYLAYTHYKPFRDIVNEVGKFLMSHLKPAFEDITKVAGFLWRNVIEPLAKFLMFTFKVYLVILIAEFVALRMGVTLAKDLFLLLWHNVLEPLGRLLHGPFMLAIDAVKLYFKLLRLEVGLIKDAFLFVWHHVFEPIAGYLSGPLHAAISAIKDVMHVVVSAAKSEWGQISDLFRKPVNAVLTFVNKFDSNVDDITSKVGLGRPLPTGLRLQRGGSVPGSGSGDIVPAMLEPGEYVLPKMLAQRIGEKNLDMMRSGGGPVNRNGVVFAKLGGGIDFNPVHAAKSVAGDFATAGSWVASTGLHKFRAGAADAIAGIFHRLMGPLNLGSGLFGQVAGGAANTVGNGVVDWVRGREAAPAATAVGRGLANAAAALSGDHMQLIAQALALAGQSPSAGNIADVNLIVSRESGWNPSAINLTDINAQEGHPSQGLMQTIPSTFAAYALPGFGGITDPLANLVAGIRYAVSRYGSLDNVPGVASVHNGGPYVGYDTGGPLKPGFTPVWNGTGRDEYVLTGGQMDEMLRLLRVIADNRLNVDGRALTSAVNGQNIRNARL